MNRIRLKSTVFAVILGAILLTSCDSNDGVIEPEAILQISEASNAAKVFFVNNLNQINQGSLRGSSAGTSQINYDDFDTNNLMELQNTEEDKTLYSALLISDPSKTLTFAMDDDGSLIQAFVTSIEEVEEGIWENKIYSTEGTLELSFNVYSNGDREVTFVNENSEEGSRYGVSGWWSRFWNTLDDCVGKFNGPTPSNIGDIVFATVMNSATLGLYTPLSVVLCAGASALSS